MPKRNHWELPRRKAKFENRNVGQFECLMSIINVWAFHDFKCEIQHQIHSFFHSWVQWAIVAFEISYVTRDDWCHRNCFIQLKKKSNARHASSRRTNNNAMKENNTPSLNRMSLTNLKKFVQPIYMQHVSNSVCEFCIEFWCDDLHIDSFISVKWCADN